MLDRRIFLASAGAWTLAACTARTPVQTAAVGGPMLVPDSQEPFPIAPVDLSRIDQRYWRQTVPDPTGAPVGTIVVDPGAKFLWLVAENGQAIRCGIGVGRQGFGWSGSAKILRKAEWPTWTPPADMMARDPDTQQWADGMPGGPDNPLGARALYLYQNGVDTLYRLHGTSGPWSIGRAVSSGCIRLLNADVIDLYRRVPVGTEVVVRPSAENAVT